uniref:Radical SAM protein n=1 Tax=candidate division WOR-3 bacterium TaxID=2052148 RepID=A0A7V3VTE6_UNCW3
MGRKRIFFEGGEPLMRDDIFEILSYIRGKFKIGISTNGTIMNSSHIELLKNTIDFVQISLDAATPETYEIIRGSRDYFSVVISNIKKLKLNNIPVVITMVLMKPNVHEISKFIELTSALGVEACAFARLQLSGRARENKDLLMLTKQEFYGAQKYISSHFKKISKFKIIRSFECFYFLFEPVSFCHPAASITIECGEGLAISPTGDVLVCNLLRDFKIGNVRKEKLETMWVNSEFLKKLRNFTIFSLCKTCDYLPVCRCGCRGCTFLETGNLYAVDPLCPFIKEKNE